MSEKKVPSKGLMNPIDMRDGSVISHKWRSGVTGEIRIRRGDFEVKWSDDRNFSRLDSYDIGKVVTY